MIEYFWFFISIVSGLMMIYYFSNALYPRNYNNNSFNDLASYNIGWESQNISKVSNNE